MSLTQEQREKYSELFSKYPVAISHLHQQYRKQLGIVLGAGIGKDLGFPDWKELIKNIANDPMVEGEELFSNPSKRTVTSQMLYQLFKEHYLNTCEGKKTYNHFGDIELKKKWKKLVHDVLYKTVEDNCDQWIRSSPYLETLINVIKGSNTMTVTYNFDDTVEKMLHKYRTNEEKGRRGYTVVWDSNVQTEKRKNIIYHPNGYLPRKISDFASEQLVFLEDSFEDQLVDSFRGHYNALNNHYSSNTCLFLGISLEDRTLKHMLRMNAKKCYGHMHYIVQHIKNHDNDQDEAQKLLVESETKANFETYNLYTMYLTSEEINTLLELILLPSEDFCDIRSKEENANYQIRRYFIMGAVAVGKSTTVSQFKCFQTFDEWLEDMPENMEKAPSCLDDCSESAIDKWIAEQIVRKNISLTTKTNAERPSISIIDRTPIDAFAFFDNELLDEEGETEEGKITRKYKLNLEWKNKAELHISQHPIEKDFRLAGGKIIFLQGDISEMLKRAKQKWRDYEEKDLILQQKELKYLATGAQKISGSEDVVSFIDVTNKTIEQVSKEVAEIIYFEKYVEADFQSILEAISKNGRDFYYD